MNSMVEKIAQAESFLIIGLGQTGLSCARFLTAKGHTVAIMDTRETPPELATLQSEMPEVLVHTGGLIVDWLLKSDTIVLSPGIDPRLPEIKAAQEQGLNIIGDIELFQRYIHEPVIAITGSNGKSTVTTMIAEMAVSAGKQVQVGGNLGVPALDLITVPAPDFYILELSSFQLETIDSLNAHAAVVLNVTADHLDRYDDEKHYQSVKAKIYNGATKMIINLDEPLSQTWLDANREQVAFSLSAPTGDDFGVTIHNGERWLVKGTTRLLACNELQLSGDHNVANALAALALGHAMGLEMTSMLTAISQYRGLAHRCQQVGWTAGIDWLDDSKATNVGACIAAIKGLNKDGRIVLIAGGVGKGQDFSTLGPVFAKSLKAIVLIGKDAELIKKVVPENIQSVLAVSMREAVSKAANLATKGDTVLLSPACASFDMFSNYAERGDVFASCVEDLSDE